LLGLVWYSNNGGWLALAVVAESFAMGSYLIFVRARAAINMEISPWYALTTPLGAGVFGAMMLTSAWKVISGQGVSWRGRSYKPK
jgi:hypothetical protein